MANDATGDIAVIFSPVIEGLMRTYGNRITPELKAQMAQRGVNLDRLLPAYPLGTFEDAFRHAGESLYPDLDHVERWRRRGREFVEGFTHTAIGGALTAMGRLIGPRRTLERAVRTFRNGSNYLGGETKVVSPTEVEVRTWMVEPYIDRWRGIPTLQLDYRVGILEGMMNALQVKNPRVTLEEKSFDTQSARYRVRWDP